MPNAVDVLELSSTQLDFGRVDTYLTSSRSLTIRNLTSALVSNIVVEIPDPKFQVTSDPCDKIEANGACVVTIQFGGSNTQRAYYSKVSVDTTGSTQPLVAGLTVRVEN